MASGIQTIIYPVKDVARGHAANLNSEAGRGQVDLAISLLLNGPQSRIDRLPPLSARAP